MVVPVKVVVTGAAMILEIWVTTRGVEVTAETMVEVVEKTLVAVLGAVVVVDLNTVDVTVVVAGYRVVKLIGVLVDVSTAVEVSVAK